MRTLKSAFAIFLLGSCAWTAIPAASHAQSTECPVVGISSDEAPPPIPDYDQPPTPGPGFIWIPGYWQWNNVEYYWVPGTWMVPPTPGSLWTPGYWEFRDGAYVFNHGYWGPHVGFYGGIDYGYGYNGSGFEGGKIKRPATNRASFNGGPQGIAAKPTSEDEAAATEPHFAPTRLQTELMREASKMDSLFESTNHGKPGIAATSRPGDFGGPGVVAARNAGTMPVPVGGAVSPEVNETEPGLANQPAANPEATTSGTGVFGGLGPVPAGSGATTTPVTGVSPKVKGTKPNLAKPSKPKEKTAAPVEKKKLEAKPPVEKPVVQKKKPPVEKPPIKPAVVEKPKPAHEEKPHPKPANESQTKPPLTTPMSGVSPKIKEAKPNLAKPSKPKEKTAAPVEKKKLEAKPPVEKPVVQKKKPPVEKPPIKPAVVEKPKPAHVEKQHLGPKPESQTKPPITTPMSGVSPKAKEAKPNLAKPPKPKEKTAPPVEKKKLEAKAPVGKPKPVHEEKPAIKPEVVKKPKPTPVTGVSPKIKEAKPNLAKPPKPKEKAAAPLEKKKLEAKPAAKKPVVVQKKKPPIEKPAVKPVVVETPKPAHEAKPHPSLKPANASQAKPPLMMPANGTVSPKVKEAKPSLVKPSSAKPKEKTPTTNVKKKKPEKKTPAEKPVDLHDD